MEDITYVRIPQIRGVNASVFNYCDMSTMDPCLGKALGGASALTYNMTQFMVGAPIVNYVSFQSTAGAPTFVLESLDTSRTAADENPTTTTFSSAEPYSTYEATLFQNRTSQKSKASGGFFLQVSGNMCFVLSSLGGGNLLGLGPALYSDAALTTQAFTFNSAGEAIDWYDSDGDYCLTTKLSGTQTGPAANIFFSVNGTDTVGYTDELNWSDTRLRTTRANPTPGGSFLGGLVFDGGRIQGNDSSDPLSLYDMQGISFQTDQQVCRVFPMARIHRDNGMFVRGFMRPNLYSTSTNGLYTTFSAGAATGGTAFAPANRGADYFTLIRGKGYIRMLGRVADPATGLPYTDGTDADKDVSYFFGMFRPYEDVDTYKHPMAFLGDVGRDTSNTDTHQGAPWWRASSLSHSTTSSSIWVENALNTGATGYWYLASPFILSREFEVNDGNTLNTPAEAQTFIPAAGQAQGRFYQAGNFSSSPQGSSEQGYHVVTEFNGQAQGTNWDQKAGWQSAQNAFYDLIESPGAPRVLPVTLRQLSLDDHSWATDPSNQGMPSHIGFSMDDDWYENIGEIPGVYWMSDRYTYAGVIDNLREPGLRYVVGGRTMHSVIGHACSPRLHTTVLAPSIGADPRNSGNLLFDINTI